MAQAKRESITRRGILSALAVLPATATPAISAPLAAVPALPVPDLAAALSAPQPPPDPVFVAIAAHKRAYADLIGFADTLADAEQTAWHAPRGSRRTANRRLKDAYAAQARLVDALSEATERFVAVVPETSEGVVAALAYIRECYAEGAARRTSA
jgi:hypothetical protein